MLEHELSINHVIRTDMKNRLEHQKYYTEKSLIASRSEIISLTK